MILRFGDIMKRKILSILSICVMAMSLGAYTLGIGPATTYVHAQGVEQSSTLNELAYSGSIPQLQRVSVLITTEMQACFSGRGNPAATRQLAIQITRLAQLQGLSESDIRYLSFAYVTAWEASFRC
tara:strand:+ start:697 stop:1074 length:378 start_codon:yes stop_codon:yes gene_type:complete